MEKAPFIKIFDGENARHNRPEIAVYPTSLTYQIGKRAVEIDDELFKDYFLKENDGPILRELGINVYDEPRWAPGSSHLDIIAQSPYNYPIKKQWEKQKIVEAASILEGRERKNVPITNYSARDWTREETNQTSGDGVFSVAGYLPRVPEPLCSPEVFEELKRISGTLFSLGSHLMAFGEILQQSQAGLMVRTGKIVSQVNLLSDIKGVIPPYPIKRDLHGDTGVVLRSWRIAR